MDLVVHKVRSYWENFICDNSYAILALLFPQVWISLHVKRFLFGMLQKFPEQALILCGGQVV
jgi:hypothetical protein